MGGCRAPRRAARTPGSSARGNVFGVGLIAVVVARCDVPCRAAPNLDPAPAMACERLGA